MTPPTPSEAAGRAAIAAAIREADAGFGYNYRLTKLVDGVETHTLFMEGFEPAEFEDREDGYWLIEERRNKVRADAVLKALAANVPPADDLRDFASLMVDEVIARARAQLDSGEGLSVDDQRHMLEQLIVERKRLSRVSRPTGDA